MRAITHAGKSLDVDTSNEACSKFGLKTGDRVTVFIINPATVIGVAPIPEDYPCIGKRRDALWIELDSQKGKVAAFLNPKDLKKA